MIKMCDEDNPNDEKEWLYNKNGDSWKCGSSYIIIKNTYCKNNCHIVSQYMAPIKKMWINWNYIEFNIVIIEN